MRPHFRFWPKRVPHAITIPATALWDNLAISTRRYPDKDALLFFDRRTSYAELLAQADRLAAYLHHHGVGAQDAKVRHYPLRAVLHVEQHPVAFLDPGVGQPCSKLLGLLGEFTVTGSTAQKI